jgi:hypothetical protein
VHHHQTFVVVFQTGSIAIAQTGILINLFKKIHIWSKFDFRFLCEKVHFFTFSTGITQVEDEISKIRSERL